MVLSGESAMLGANLALIVLLGQIPATDPTALVARLGSPRYADREAAAGDLERLGRHAIPALRSARDARDLEIRTRAQALVNKIEGALLTQPTLIQLDFEDRPLPEVLKTVSEQAGIKLGLIPENSPSWPNRRITLHESTPLPFWKAMDRICDAARLQYNVGMHGMATSREQVFPLFDGGPRVPGPTSDSGPFRVCLLSLHYQRDVAFNHAAAMIPQRGVVPPRPLPAGIVNTPQPDGPAVIEQFYAQVQVSAEPRLSLSQNGPLRILEAVDDRGQSLAPESGDGPVTQRFSGYYGLTSGSALQLQAQLRHPEQPGQSIRKLRGILPIMVATRKPEPLVVPLQGGAGKSFHNDDVNLSILDVRINPANNQTSIDLVIRPGAPSSSGFAPQGGNGSPFQIQRPDMHQQQIEVVDSQGRVIPWYHSSFDAEGARMTLTLTPHDQAAPTELHYFGLARASTEVSFEFSNIPMP
jgi:hypothetical protein